MTPRDPKPPGVPSLNTPGLTLPPMPMLPAAQVLRSLERFGGDAANEGGWLTIRKALEARVLLEEAGIEALADYAQDVDAMIDDPEDDDCDWNRIVRLLNALARTLSEKE